MNARDLDRLQDRVVASFAVTSTFALAAVLDALGTRLWLVALGSGLYSGWLFWRFWKATS